LKNYNQSTLLVSIVTVVYNGVGAINATLNSVLGQSYPNIQYVIIDGGSTDGTLQIINKYQDQIDVYISEPDLGIYDAMNKALSYCKGTWVNYMNCGDIFYSSNTVEIIFNDLLNREADILFGKHVVSYYEKLVPKLPNPINELWKGMTIQHQSIFAKTEFLLERKFNLSYKFAADYNFLYDCYKHGCNIVHLDVFVSIVAAQGFSESNSVETYKEFRKIALKYENSNPAVIKYYSKLLFNRRLVSIFKKTFTFSNRLRLIFK
jgi:glycosyltransferase involved in cell wall biosynthesis